MSETGDKWKADSLKLPKIPAKLGLDGRLWARFCRICFRKNFPEFRKKNVNSERGEIVRDADYPLVYSLHSTAGDLWRAPIRLLLKTHLAAGV